MPGSGAPIVLDAMGGDHAPREQVAGAVAAVREHGVQVVLAGDAGTLRPLLDAHGAAADIEVVHAAEVIPMGGQRGADGRPARHQRGGRLRAGRQRPGRAPWCPRARPAAPWPPRWPRWAALPGVLRPAIAVCLPTAGRGTVLLDAGATADPTPEMLAQFAVLGSGYARAVLGLESPTVGLLTIGSEPGKGNRLARRAQPLLCAAPVRFTGNVEGRDALAGAVDVVVTDGFTGNVALKTIEGSLRLGAHRGAGRAHRRAGRRAVAHLANRAGCAAWPNGSTPTRTAGRCCSAWAAPSSSRTARPGPGPSRGRACWPGTWPGRAGGQAGGRRSWPPAWPAPARPAAGGPAPVDGQPGAAMPWAGSGGAWPAVGQRVATVQQADPYGMNRAKHSSANQPPARVRVITAACAPPGTRSRAPRCCPATG